MSPYSEISIKAVLIRPQFTFNTDPLSPHTLYVPLNAHTPTSIGYWGSACPFVFIWVVNSLSSSWEDHLLKPVCPLSVPPALWRG